MTSVFLAGLSVMAAEMTAPRLLAPAFGATQLIWTNIIGTVLAALTLGAWLGGRLADRFPSETAYARVLVLAGLLLAGVPMASGPLLDSASHALAQQRAGSFLASLGAVCLFFAPPVFLLGTITPWAIRLAGIGRLDLGRIAGMISGLGALGSIVGTFGASLVTIPLLGTRRTLLCVAALLVAAGAWRVVPGWARVGVAAVALVLSAVPNHPVHPQRSPVFAAESFYQYVEVEIDGAGFARLYLDEGLGVQSIRAPRGALTGGYWDFLAALPALVSPGDGPLRVLILGLAAGTVAQQIDRFRGDRSVSMVGVEIDPVVVEAGRRFFGLDKIPNLEIHVADARPFLAAQRGPFDLIVADAYRGFYIPFSLTTLEFYQACRERLAPDGIFALNLATPRRARALLDSFSATLRSAFPHVTRFQVVNEDVPFSNFVYLGSRRPLLLPADESLTSPLRGMARRIRRSWEEPQAAEGSWIFTDDRAPVELLTDAILLSFVTQPG